MKSKKLQIRQQLHFTWNSNFVDGIMVAKGATCLVVTVIVRKLGRALPTTIATTVRQIFGLRMCYP
jgi:hypothetical protein